MFLKSFFLTKEFSDKDKLNSFILLFIIVLITFSPVLFNGFTNWDDDIYITQNPKIRELSLKNIVHIFTSTHYGGYEPLTEFVFAIDYHFFKLNPFFYHLNNLILHTLNVFLVFFLVYLLTDGNFWLSLLTAAIWGIHPLRVESVAWAAERKDLLFSFFFLLSLICYIYYIKDKKIKFYLLSLSFYFISLLPKAQGLFLPFILILFDYYFNEKINARNILLKVPYFLVLIVFFFMLFFGEMKYNRMTDLFDFKMLIKNIFYANFALVFYLVKFVFPVKLTACYPLPEKSSDIIFKIIYYISPIIVVICFVFLIFYIIKKDKIKVLVILFYFINLLLVLQIKRTSTAIVADRYGYIPHIAISFFCGVYYFKYYSLIQNKFKIIPISLLLLFLSAFGFLSFNRAMVWKDSYTLWSNAVKEYPETALAHNNLAAAIVEKNGDSKEAIAHYEKSIELDPTNYVAYSNLGAIYNNIRMTDKAIETFIRGLAIKSDFAPFYLNLALTYHNRGEIDKALANYKKCIELDKKSVLAYSYLIEILLSKGLKEEADFYIKEAVTNNPDLINKR